MTTTNGAAKIKPGDQVWYPETQEELIVAVVDADAGTFAPCGWREQWIPLGAVTLQRACEDAASVAMITTWARETLGQRPVVARRALARLWSEGKLARKGSA